MVKSKEHSLSLPRKRESIPSLRGAAKLRRSNLAFKTIAMLVACAFLLNGLAFALAPYSRLEPFIAKQITEQGWSFNDKFLLGYAAGELKRLALANATDGEIARFNVSLLKLSNGELELIKNSGMNKFIETANFKTGKPYQYAVIKLKKEKGQPKIKVAISAEPANLTSDELNELEIRTSDDRNHFFGSSLNGVWLIAPKPDKPVSPLAAAKAATIEAATNETDPGNPKPGPMGGMDTKFLTGYGSHVYSSKDDTPPQENDRDALIRQIDTKISALETYIEGVKSVFPDPAGLGYSAYVTNEDLANTQAQLAWIRRDIPARISGIDKIGFSSKDGNTHARYNYLDKIIKQLKEIRTLYRQSKDNFSKPNPIYLLKRAVTVRDELFRIFDILSLPADHEDDQLVLYPLPWPKGSFGNIIYKYYEEIEVASILEAGIIETVEFILKRGFLREWLKEYAGSIPDSSTPELTQRINKIDKFLRLIVSSDKLPKYADTEMAKVGIRAYRALGEYPTDDEFKVIWQAHLAEAPGEKGSLGQPDSYGIYRHSTLSGETIQMKYNILAESGYFNKDKIKGLLDYGACGKEGESEPVEPKSGELNRREFIQRGIVSVVSPSLQAGLSADEIASLAKPLGVSDKLIYMISKPALGYLAGARGGLTTFTWENIDTMSKLPLNELAQTVQSEVRILQYIINGKEYPEPEESASIFLHELPGVAPMGRWLGLMSIEAPDSLPQIYSEVFDPMSILHRDSSFAETGKPWVTVMIDLVKSDIEDKEAVIKQWSESNVPSIKDAIEIIQGELESLKDIQEELTAFKALPAGKQRQILSGILRTALPKRHQELEAFKVRVGQAVALLKSGVEAVQRVEKGGEGLDKGKIDSLAWSESDGLAHNDSGVGEEIVSEKIETVPISGLGQHGASLNGDTPSALPPAPKAAEEPAGNRPQAEIVDDTTIPMEIADSVAKEKIKFLKEFERILTILRTRASCNPSKHLNQSVVVDPAMIMSAFSEESPTFEIGYINFCVRSIRESWYSMAWDNKWMEGIRIALIDDATGQVVQTQMLDSAGRINFTNIEMNNRIFRYELTKNSKEADGLPETNVTQEIAAGDSFNPGAGDRSQAKNADGTRNLEEASDEAKRIYDEMLKPEYMPPEADQSKTIVYRIIPDSVLPAGQGAAWLDPLQSSMRGVKYSEKVVYFKVDGSRSFADQVRETMGKVEIASSPSAPRNDDGAQSPYTIEFDVACPGVKEVAEIHNAFKDRDKVKALAFRPCEDIDVSAVQAHGIILAFRALRTNDLTRLKAAYKFLGGEEPDLKLDEITSIERFVIEIAFRLPPAKKLDGNDKRRFNELISEYFRQAA